MSQNVRFYFGTQTKYDALLEKNPLALYFIEDTQRLYKGDTLLAVGAEATSLASGLMSKEDKEKLDALTVGGISSLTPVDGTIVIADTEDGGQSIGVAISTERDNALMALEDGLFVPHAIIPRYAIEKQDVAAEGFAATYRLKEIVGENADYVGDEINIGKDMVLHSATLEIVSKADAPYAGAVVGDPYIDMAFNDVNASHIYVPVKDLVDTYFAGNGIEIVDNTISVKIAEESHGLVAVEGGLALSLATKDNDGAMSKEDKALIDSIPEIYATIEQVTEITNKIEESYTWTEM